ncbi:non-specific serine/threonine protein kinase [Citrus sinensis]|nr:G-type lectin S-receptor-like serine/threonine-protein kinase LECRK4 [Citrus x clementina]XP_006464872.1 G-type lectin S-receptor-like serine/threonine-protein kinase LECRK4 [Citrus sinensis]KAH9669108.1 non-specific serine/threonine protein kinase [Citrus sinensis]
MKLFLLIIIIFIYLFSTSQAQSPRSNYNIAPGSTLYTNSSPNFWPSPSGHFAFGFYTSGNGFKVGIWLVDGSNRTNKTIVWTARREDPVVSSGAALQFSVDGSRVLLRNSNGEVQSIAEPTQSSAVAASMLDSGNFVLYDSSSRIVWASFDRPTDTLLVGQKLAQNTALRSSTSLTNQSVGNFELWMERWGSLTAFPKISIQVTKYAYWSSFTDSAAGQNVTLNLGRDGRLYLENSTGYTVKNLTEGGLSVNRTNLYRATLDVDGIFRLYQNQVGTNGGLSSKIVWAAINEEDRCQVKVTCGLNSYCSLRGSGTACLCPPGFIYNDQQRPQDGCKLNFSTGDDCLEDQGSNSYNISHLENIYWEPDEYDLINHIPHEETCSNACLGDCNCVVAKYKDPVCYKHKLPLGFGMKNDSSGIKSLVKVRIGGFPKGGDRIVNKKTGKDFVIIGVFLTAFSLIVFLSALYLFYAHQIWSYKVTSRGASPPDVVEEINMRSFSYEQLVVATKNFEEEIGRGGSGRVYKGSINGGKEVAVKKLIKMVEEGESEFRNEIKIIGRTHHKNLVQLVGFCTEGSNRLLVYEFMKNGSLANLLFTSEQRPSWNERRRIALEIAKGIHYLHDECETRIIHCDIKPQNILMDESWTAKISDFGLSKLLKPDQTRTYTILRGTRGYTAPEWHSNNSPITVKSDVYSFGVMLLEIVCCRKNMDETLRDQEVVLIDWAYHYYEAGEVQNLVIEEDHVDMEELEKMVKIGLWCVETEFSLRPTMKQVILMMEGFVATPPPPSPYSSIRG